MAEKETPLSGIRKLHPTVDPDIEKLLEIPIDEITPADLYLTADLKSQLTLRQILDKPWLRAAQEAWILYNKHKFNTKLDIWEITDHDDALAVSNATLTRGDTVLQIDTDGAADDLEFLYFKNTTGMPISLWQIKVICTQLAAARGVQVCCHDAIEIKTNANQFWQYWSTRTMSNTTPTDDVFIDYVTTTNQATSWGWVPGAFVVPPDWYLVFFIAAQLGQTEVMTLEIASFLNTLEIDLA